MSYCNLTDFKLNIHIHEQVTLLLKRDSVEDLVASSGAGGECNKLNVKER